MIISDQITSIITNNHQIITETGIYYQIITNNYQIITNKSNKMWFDYLIII